MMYKPTRLPAYHDNPYKEQVKKVGMYSDTFQTDDSEIKVFIQREPPEVLNIVNEIIKNQDKYDLILAWNEDVLDNCKNAKKFLFGDCWLKSEFNIADKQNYISFLTSDKNYATGHKLRQEVYNILQKNKRINGYKVIAIKTPPRIPDKDVIFESSKYSIIIENQNIKNFFTEKLIDCLISKTVPIYCGCPNVSEYFNTDGMILFETTEELMRILNNLDDFEYEKKFHIFEENFEKAKEYVNFFERADSAVEEFLKNK